MADYLGANEKWGKLYDMSILVKGSQILILFAITKNLYFNWECHICVSLCCINYHSNNYKQQNINIKNYNFLKVIGMYRNANSFRKDVKIWKRENVI